MITRYKIKKTNERTKKKVPQQKLFTYFYNVFVIQHDNRLEYEFAAHETISQK